LELRHLKYFLAVAETLNISEASRRLRVAQPSLSRQIRALEFEVGQPLFDRHRGKLSLTAAGAVLRQGTSRILEQVEAAVEQARQAGAAPVTVLRVGYYGMMWATVIAAALRQFRRLCPKTKVTFAELSPAQIVEALKQGALDLAVVGHGTGGDCRELSLTRIASVAALLALSPEHPLAKRRVLSLEDLRGETFLTYAPGYAPGRDASFLRACRKAGFKPKLACEARGLPALLLLVAENRGVAIVSPFAPRAPHPGVVFVRLRPPGVTFDIAVAQRRNLPPMGRRLADLIVEVSRRDLLEKSGPASAGG
jgi:LysR family transcriptional regulator, benzoate and cis,cis-muconate-responsive activator of ben and cat genes